MHRTFAGIKFSNLEVNTGWLTFAWIGESAWEFDIQLITS